MNAAPSTPDSDSSSRGRSGGRSADGYGPALALVISLGLLLAALLLGAFLWWRSLRAAVEAGRLAVLEAARAEQRVCDERRRREDEADLALARAGVRVHSEPAVVFEGAKLGIRALLLPDFEPLAGARVSLRFSAGSASLAGEHLCDESGSLELDCALPARLRDVRVAAGREHAAARLQLDAPLRADRRLEVQIAVPPGWMVSGRVVDGEGAAVPYARVLGWCRPSPELDAAGPDPGADADRREHADAQGRFRLPHMGPTFTLQAEAEGGACARAASGELAGAGLEQEVELLLLPARALEGRVVDAAGAPVAAAAVRARWVPAQAAPGGDAADREGDRQDPEPPGDRTPTRAVARACRPRDRETASDAGGRYRIEGLAAGETYRVQAESRGRVTARLARITGDELELVLEETIEVAGRVLAAEGGSLREARVGLLGGADFERVDEHAAFALRVPARAASSHLVALAPGRAPALACLRRAGVGQALELRLHPQATLRGRVGDGAGAALAGARLTLSEPRLQHAPCPDCELSGSVLLDDLGLSAASSDEDGAFSFASLPEGDYTLRVAAGNDSGLARELPVRTGAQALEVVLAAVPTHTAEIGGVVVDRISGAALQDFVIEALRGSDPDEVFEGAPQRFVETDGRFRIGLLRAGAYRLRARAPGYAPEVLSLELPLEEPKELEFRLAPERRVELAFVDTAGNPIERASLAVRRADGSACEFRPGSASGQTGFARRLRIGPEGAGVALLPAEMLELELHVAARLEPLSYALDASAEGTGARVFVVEPNPELHPGELRVLFLEVASGAEIGAGWLGTLEPALEARVLARDRIEPLRCSTPAGDEPRVEVVVRDAHGARVGEGRLACAAAGKWSASWRTVGESQETRCEPERLPVMRLVVPRRGFRLEARGRGYLPLSVEIPGLAGLDGDAAPAIALVRKADDG